MLMNFTEEQKTLLIEHRDQYLDFILNNYRHNPNNLELNDVKEDIKWIYEYMGFTPPKYIFFADSYLQEKMMINFILYGGLNAMLDKKQLLISDKMYIPTTVRSSSFVTNSDIPNTIDDPPSGLTLSVLIIRNQHNQVRRDLKNSHFPNSSVVGKDPKSNPINNIDFYGLKDMVSSLWQQVKQQQQQEQEEEDSNSINPSKTLSTTSLTSEILRDVAKQVSTSISTSTWAQAWSPIRTIIRDQVHTNIRNIIESLLENKLYNNSVFDYKKIKQQLSDELLQDQQYTTTVESLDLLVIIDSTNKFLQSFNKNGENHLKFVEQNFGVTQDIWLSSYSFFQKIGILEDDKFSRYNSFMQKGIWSAQFFQDWCIITQLPKRISRDPQTRLHSIDGPVLEWRSRGSKITDKQYYIHGINFSEDLWDKIVTNKITIGEILKIDNMEQRQAMLSVISPKKFIDECKGILISTHIQKKKGKEYMNEKDYDTVLNHKKIELYRIDDVVNLALRNPLYVLLYSDPSTSREYFIFVHPATASDAAAAMAGTLGLTREQYINITAET